MTSKKTTLLIVIIALAVILVGAVIVGLFLGVKKGWFGSDKPETKPAASTVTTAGDGTNTTEGTDVDGTDPAVATTAPTGTTATDPSTGKKQDPDDDNHGDDPVDPVVDETVPADPVVTEPPVTEATEPKEPTVGVDTDTTPPQPDNVIDFDDLLNAGKTDG